MVELKTVTNGQNTFLDISVYSVAVTHGLKCDSKLSPVSASLQKALPFSTGSYY